MHRKERQKRRQRLICGILFLVLLGGCKKMESDSNKNRQAVDFTVIENREIPEKLLEVIEKNKAEEIRLSYTEGENLYLVRGYGEQKTGGYSISVTDCSEDEQTLWLDTRLLGPSNQEKQTKEPSYPYLVVKLDLREKEVMIT